MDDIRTAHDALATAHTHLQRGARSIGPRHRVRYAVVSCIAATAVGATFDIPTDWHDIGALLRTPMALVIIAAWTLYTRVSWRARPRPQVYSRYAMAAIIGAHIVGSFAATALGHALQQAHVPLPFTLAGLLYGVVFTALVVIGARRASDRYVDRVIQGQW